MATKFVAIKNVLTITSDDPVAIAGVVAAITAMGAEPMTLAEYSHIKRTEKS